METEDCDSESSHDSVEKSIVTVENKDNLESLGTLYPNHYLYLNVLDGEEYNPLIPEDEELKPLSIAELKLRYMRNYILSNKDKYCHDRKLS